MRPSGRRAAVLLTAVLISVNSTHPPSGASVIEDQSVAGLMGVKFN